MAVSKNSRSLLWWWTAVVGGAAGSFAMSFCLIASPSPYGLLLFCATPFIHGALVAYIVKRTTSSGNPEILGAVSVSTFLLACISLVVFHIEGAICTIMAAPIWLAIAMLGMLTGKYVGGLRKGAPVMFCVVPVVLLMSASGDYQSRPPVRKIVTSIVVDAPPGKVWPLLLNLDGYGRAEAWFFRAGVAHPVGTTTDPEEVKRIAHTSTGNVVQTITELVPNKRLRWRDENTPPTMVEWNPFGDPRPSHVTETFDVYEGGFDLVALPGGKTRLTGFTTFRIRMEPEVYWSFWANTVMRAVHLRTMELISSRAKE
jgi:hypothetical protein